MQISPAPSLGFAGAIFCKGANYVLMKSFECKKAERGFVAECVLLSAGLP